MCLFSCTNLYTILSSISIIGSYSQFEKTHQRSYFPEKGLEHSVQFVKMKGNVFIHTIHVSYLERNPRVYLMLKKITKTLQTKKKQVFKMMSPLIRLIPRRSEKQVLKIF